MVNKLRNLKGERIVVVVGAAHLDGMVETWDRLEKRKEELNMSDEDLDHP